METIDLARPQAILTQKQQEFARSVTPYLVESAIAMTKFVNLEEALRKSQSMYHPNTLVAFISTHRSHCDVATVVHTVREARKALPDITTVHLPIAVSLYRGQQGVIADTFFHHGARPILEELKTNALPIASDNDIKIRKIKPSISDAKAFSAAIAQDRSAFFAFPEASVRGGRNKKILGLPIGRMVGSLELHPAFIPKLLHEAEKRQRELIVVPIGTSGTNNMLSADTLLPTLRGLIGLVQLRFKGQPKLATVTYGEPFILQGFDYGSDQDLTASVASKINHLIPKAERGFYQTLTAT